MSREVLIGHAGVDSGCVTVGDPCYLVQSENGNQLEWDAVVDACFDEKGRQVTNEHGAPVVNVNGAFIIGTPSGDGSYPVYAELNSNNEVVSVRIELDPVDDDEEDQCWGCNELESECVCGVECPRCGSTDFNVDDGECNEPGCDYPDEQDDEDV